MGSIRNITGQRFGRLVVLESTDIRIRRRVVWKCLCDCGNTCEVESVNLTRGDTQSCGCLSREVSAQKGRLSAKNILNQRFGKLTALSPTERRKVKSVVWKCLCDCGNICETSSSDLTKGGVQSCGCLVRETSSRNGKLTAKDIAGKKFGRLLALYPTENRSANGGIIWRCVCDCGNETKVAANALLSSNTKSCGCLNREHVSLRHSKDITNRVFGRLLSLEPTENRDGSGCIIWKCLCDCGNTCEISSANLLRGCTQSCGCLYCKGSVYLYVYRSLNHDIVKIGISGNVIKRKGELEEQLNDSLELLHYRLSSRSEENTIHRQLKQYRAVHPNQPKGKEWFLYKEEVMDISQHKQQA